MKGKKKLAYPFRDPGGKGEEKTVKEIARRRKQYWRGGTPQENEGEFTRS